MAVVTAFDYIVRQILNRRCVPVAGAGISLSSTHSKGLNVHNVGWIVSELERELLKMRHARYDVKSHGEVCDWGCVKSLKKHGIHVNEKNLSKSNCFFCDVRSATEFNKLGNLSELFLWEFDKLGTAYIELVKLLKIKSYIDLNPTDAHKYIAKIAREGLIDEVLTTNYDCNFEKSYDAIIGNKHSDVISSLGDYRQKGATGDSVNRLKVYKVNGCAEKLGNAKDSKKCESILLTERQLQKWRNRRWAEDIFRDRLRSKSLLFIGFGSDEPQIHHTLQTVLDEYADDSENNTTHVLQTPAAPIVAIYDPQPTFHQQQIVNTYALHHKQESKQGNELIIRNPIFGETLSADTLWKLIYERVIRTSIINGLELSLLAANASFTSIVPFSQTILHKVISSLKKSIETDKDFSTVAPSWLTSFYSICGSSVKTGHHFEALVSCITILNNKETELYEPVNENQALISEFFLLLFLLKSYVSTEIHNKSNNGISLEFKSTVLKSVSKKILYLNADPAVISNGDQINTPIGNNHLTLILGQAGAHVRPSLRRVSNTNQSSESVTPKTIVALSWQHIFHEKPYNGNMDTVAETLIDAIDSPTNYYFTNQPSLKRRTYLKEV